MLSPNPGLVIWTIITFIILLGILKKIAWKPLLNVLNSREESVKNAIDQAEKARSEAERILKENQKALENANIEGQKILQESRALAEKLKEDIISKANLLSKKMIETAKEEIERDKEAAIIHLRSEIATIAVEAAGKIIDENLNEEKHRKLIDLYVQQFPRN